MDAFHLTDLYQFPKYRSLENFALDQTEQFLKPRTFLDLVFLILLIFWWGTSFLIPQSVIFRATIFSSLLFLFLFTPLYIVLSEVDKSADSAINRAVKILLFYILILISTPNSTIPDLWGSALTISYGELERAIVCILVPFTILLNSFSPRTLKLGYLYYVQTILHRCWISSLIIYFFEGISLYHSLPFLELDFDLLLLIAFSMLLIASLLPIVPRQLSLSTADLFSQYQALKSRTERFRDALLFGGLCFIVFILLKWIDSNYIEYFQFIAFFSLIIGIVFIFTPRKQNRKRFGALLDSISSQTQMIDPTSQLGNRIHSFAQSVQEAKFQKPERVYTIPTDQIKLVSKGKTTIKANKGAIAVPTITEKGTALVVMGKSELETLAEDKEKSTKKEIEGTTTLWLSPEEWSKIKLQLIPKEVSKLTENELKEAGIDTVTVTEIFEKTKNALSDLKAWRGPQGIFSSVLDVTPSKYSITETKDYSLVRLPGVYVFESNMIELVHIMGGLVKVIEIKGVGEYIQILGGLVTVMETPEYSFVQTPFVSVIETPKGEQVRVFGIDIHEGEKLDLEEMRTKILQDQRNFDELFTKRVETLFEKDPQLLLANSKGQKMGFIVGQNTYLSDVPEDENRIKGVKRRKTKAKRGRKFHMEMKKSFKFTSNIVREHKTKDKLAESVTFDLDTEGVPKDHPQLLKMDEELVRLEEAIIAADDKLLNSEISEDKHSELINRLEVRKDKLVKEKENLVNQLRLKFV